MQSPSTRSSSKSTVQNEMPQIADGMLPVSALVPRSSLVMAVNNPNSVGMLPVWRLCEIAM